MTADRGIKLGQRLNLVPEDVHDEREDGCQLEEEEHSADHHEGVVQVEVVQEILESEDNVPISSAKPGQLGWVT